MTDKPVLKRPDEKVVKPRQSRHARPPKAAEVIDAAEEKRIINRFERAHISGDC